MNTKKTLIAGLVILFTVLLAACGSPTPEPTVVVPIPTQIPCPTSAPCPDCPACPPEPVVKDVPFEAMWVASAHADASALAFTRWDADDPAVIPENCAKCHSATGYLDFVGEDGSEAGVVNQPAPVGTVISCIACHNAGTVAMSSVVFPSGAEMTGLGPEARCMQCHQGRASTVQVDGAITNAGLTDDDTVGGELGFVNIHYFAAAATLYGTQTQGGYQYPGKAYDAKNDHVAGYDTCIGCHNPHSLELKLDECSVCHAGVATQEDARNIRMVGSLMDYDGDGDVTEGIAFEITGLQEMLYQAIQAYATEVAGTAVVYDSHTHPYFFIDSNADGATDADEVASANRYNAWTGRMLKAAYNYQTSLKDPGAYAHGGKYIIQLLYDSIEDLNTKIANPVDLSKARRIDAGHFAGSQEAFRHWDAEGEVPRDCAKCHSASGLPTFLKEASMASDRVSGVNIAVHPSNGLNCATCHDDVAAFTRFPVNNVRFPSGAIVTFGEGNDANLCINCHQGRESTTSLNAAIQRAGVEDDVVSEALTFRNPHYFAAGATLFGSEARGAYEYAGQTYNGRNPHVDAFSTCIQCHDSHALEVKILACSGCHAGVASTEDLKSIRFTPGDFDGDGDEQEGMAGEIATLEEMLFEAIQAYATETIGTGIVYDSHAYPYFFTDTNGNGLPDPEEINFGNRYATWTPRLLRAVYNYVWVAKDPGAYAHNGKYMLQILYDSLNDVGVDVSGMIRP